MHLSMRSWSLNQHCLSKVWFRSHSVDLRVMDVSNITSSVKSWLYADQLIKPEELIMSRPPTFGGLGVHNVKWKAIAGLIRTFLETACIPKFQTSLYHSQLYRYHVLDDQSLSNPGYPPFYNAEFFNIIRRVHRESPLNVSKMTENQWYTLLVEEHVTMENVDGGPDKYILSHNERKNPQRNWEECWKLARLHGLHDKNFLKNVRNPRSQDPAF